jgi:hypothetical protein
MEHRLKTKDGRAIYAKRKCTVEPVFGIIKAIMGFRQFSLRGVKSVRGEWNLVCMAWNLKSMTSKDFTPAIDKKASVEMLKSAGIDEDGMRAWHTEFERRSPGAHFDFLLSLGIPESEARRIQEWSKVSE